MDNLRTRLLMLAALSIIAAVLVFPAALATTIEPSQDPVTGTATSNNAGISVTTPASYLSCQSGALDFTLEPGHLTAAGMSIGTIENSTWGDCFAPFDLQMNVQQLGTWTVEALSGLVGGTGTIELNGIAARASDSGGICSLDVTGSATASIDLDSHEISVASVGSEIIATNIEGCFGQVIEGDPIAVNATFNIP